MAIGGRLRSRPSRSRSSRTRRSIVQTVVHQLEVEVLRRRRCPGTPRRWPAPARSRRCAARSAPRRDGQPVVPISPCGVLGEQLAVQRAACRRSPRRRTATTAGTGCACRRVLSASSVMWVNAPPPETSSSPPAAHRTRELVVPRGVGRDVGLHADDRLEAGGRGLAVEVVGAEHVAVVGHRHRRHAQARGLGEQVVEPGGTVEHRVLGVDMQVDERVAVACCHCRRTPSRRSGPRFSHHPPTTGRRPGGVSLDLWYRLMGRSSGDFAPPGDARTARQQHPAGRSGDFGTAGPGCGAQAVMTTFAPTSAHPYRKAISASGTWMRPCEPPVRY